MMKLIKYPKESEWPSLCNRAAQPSKDMELIVRGILSKVKQFGDRAIVDLTGEFDGVDVPSLSITIDQEDPFLQVSTVLKQSIRRAAKAITLFHESQLMSEPSVETYKGVTCWRKSVPLDSVGIYVPCGTAPLFSSLLMLAIPAKLASVTNLVVCSPPNAIGQIDPVLQFTASLLDIKVIHPIGGAQAIGAMAYGTETINNVDKIVGPGNQFVTLAKQLVQLDAVAIDMPAGPSEILVIADHTSDPEFVAADLLSQAEHGIDSQVLLLSDELTVINAVLKAVSDQVEVLPRKEIAMAALENSHALLFHSIDKAISFSNKYAPEHLILAINDYEQKSELIANAGSVFLGNYSCESAGDYASGANHTLPTGGWAKSYSGVSVDTFMKKITFQEITAVGIQSLGSVVAIMAEAEQLLAHKNAVSLRLKKLSAYEN